VIVKAFSIVALNCSAEDLQPLLRLCEAMLWVQVVWGHCVDLLQRGFTSGSILTVDPEDARLLGKPWTRR